MFGKGLVIQLNILSLFALFSVDKRTPAFEYMKHLNIYTIYYVRTMISTI